MGRQILLAEASSSRMACFVAKLSECESVFGGRQSRTQILLNDAG